MPDRRYDQNEMAAIFRSAAEAQAKESARAEGEGLTLDEIQKVAGEVGIDPKHIARAAESLGQSSHSKVFQLGGRPYSEIIEREFEGEFDDTSWGEVVDDLRTTFGGPGEISAIGSGREWKGGTDFKVVHLSARPVNGRTKIRLTITHQGIFFGWMGLVLTSLFGSLIGGISVAKSGAPVFATLSVVLAIIATVTLSMHLILAKWHGKHDKQLDRLLDRIKEHTSKPIQRSQMTHVEEELPSRLSQQH